MPKYLKKSSGKAGLAPGTLIHIGEKKTDEAEITLIEYGAETYVEKRVANIEEIFPLKDSPTISWINVDGIHDIAITEKIWEHLKIHSLTLEDILNTNQRPKIEEFDDYLYVVLKMFCHDKETCRINAEQASFILGANFLVSFQEMKSTVFDSVKDRLAKGKGRMRRRGPDYLLYLLMDAIIDNYFFILDSVGEETEKIEEEMIFDSSHKTLLTLHSIKRELIFFRKNVWYVREFLHTITYGETALIEDSTVVFLRDLYDHSAQVLDTLESFRDVMTGVQEIYLSGLSNKMNEVMKVLTIIATLFIPVTFIAGVYGMNFKFMPELEQKWGYPAFWIIVCIAIIGMLVYFKRKKWL